MVHRASESAADLKAGETVADLQASFGEVKARMVAMHSTGSWLMSISDLAYLFLSFSQVSLLQNHPWTKRKIYILFIYLFSFSFTKSSLESTKKKKNIYIYIYNFP